MEETNTCHAPSGVNKVFGHISRTNAASAEKEELRMLRASRT